MGKVCLIAFHDLYLMQFLYKYTEFLDANKIEYDVIYWERESEAKKAKEFDGTPISFQYETSYYGSKIYKVKGYLKYISFVCKKLKEGKYNKVILLTTQAALPMYLFSYRLRHNIKYVYDYRDITFEHLPFCKGIIKRIINKSVFTSISSLGFKSVLGENDRFLISHNTSEPLKFEAVEKKVGKKIRIVYWGMVRQVEFNKKVITFFGNDDRFELIYHGGGYTEELQAFCKSNNYKNVIFTGSYTTDQIKEFVKYTDILLNLYENDGQQKLATTVKFYDGMRYGLPMLVAKGSHMEMLLKDLDYVACIDLKQDQSEKIYHWYNNLPKRVDPYSDYIAQINTDDAEFKRRLLEFVR